ncbi:MAG: hypothetical protein ABIK89_26690 [Planctomycetota bacterium]
MQRVLIATAFMAGWIALCSARPAQAQRNYHVSRPTFSPYLQLFRLDPGPLGQYHSYVLPQRQLERTIAGQSAQIQQQQAGIRSVRGQISQFQQAGPVAPTGRGSAFGNHMSYFGNHSSHYSGGTAGTAGRTNAVPRTSGRSGSLGSRGSSGLY